MSVCVCVVKRFQIATPPTVFVRLLWKLAQMVCVPYRKNCAADFPNFASKIFGKFFKFRIVQLGQGSTWWADALDGFIQQRSYLGQKASSVTFAKILRLDICKPTCLDHSFLL